MEKVKFNVCKSSSWGYEEQVEFETLQDFLNYVKKSEHQIIVSFNHDKQKYELEVYDTYRE